MSTLMGRPVIENEWVTEGSAIVGVDVAAGGGSAAIVMHPVDVIRLRMWDAGPWEVFDAIAEWRLQHALRAFDLRNLRRDADLHVSLECFVILARLQGRALDRWIAAVFA